MPLQRARRLPPPRPDGSPGRPTGVSYRQQYVRCGKPGCRRCPPHGPGHGPYWYGYYWDYRQRTRSFYVGKQLPAGAQLVGDSPPIEPSAAADTTSVEKGAGDRTVG
jgi:hypothetical protein